MLFELFFSPTGSIEELALLNVDKIFKIDEKFKMARSNSYIKQFLNFKELWLIEVLMHLKYLPLKISYKKSNLFAN